MKITFLGTSHGVPERDRFCACTLIETGDRKYIVDGGAPVASLLISRGMTPTDIDAAFVTHLHGDHVNGLIEMIDLESWYFREANTRFFFPEQSGIDAIRALLRATHGGQPPREIPMEVYGSGVIYDDGTLRVTAEGNNHLAGNKPPRPAYSFALECEGKRVIMTGDMGAGFADFVSMARNAESDLVICEAAHTRLTEAQVHLREAKTKRMLFNHIAPINAGFPELEMPFPYGYAKDGEIVEI